MLIIQIIKSHGRAGPHDQVALRLQSEISYLPQVCAFDGESDVETNKPWFMLIIYGHLFP